MESSKVSAEKTGESQNPQKFGRPQKSKGWLAVCPNEDCKMKGTNLWNCVNCGLEFESNLKIVKALIPAKTKELFIKKENSEPILENGYIEIKPTTSISSTDSISSSLEIPKKLTNNKEGSKKAGDGEPAVPNSMFEKRIRVFHASTEFIHRSMIASVHRPVDQMCSFQAQMYINDTVIEESRLNDRPEILRILQVGIQKEGVQMIQRDKNYPMYVKKLIFGGPCSLEVIFEILQSTKLVSSIRMGKHALNLCSADKKPININVFGSFKSNLITNFELAFDKRQYTSYSKDEKGQMHSKILGALNLASHSFPMLEECNIAIPDDVKSGLENFLRIKPDFLLKGVKKDDYRQKIIQFTVQNEIGTDQCTQPPDIPSSQTEKKGSQTVQKLSETKDVIPSKSTVVKQDSDANKKIKSKEKEATLTQKSEASKSNGVKSESYIDCIDLSSDEESTFSSAVVGSNTLETQNVQIPSHIVETTSKIRDSVDSESPPLDWDGSSETIPGHVAPCSKCGTYSINLKHCDNCQEQFPSRQPIQLLKKRKRNEDIQILGSTSRLESENDEIQILGIPKNSDTSILNKGKETQADNSKNPCRKKSRFSDTKDETQNLSPSSIKNKIILVIKELFLMNPNTTLPPIIVNCQYIRIHEYKWVSDNTPLKMIFHEIGLCFQVSKFPDALPLVKCAVPISEIIRVSICFSPKLPSIFLIIRRECYDCFESYITSDGVILDTSKTEVTMVLLLKREMNDEDKGRLIKIFGARMQKLDFEKGRSMMLNISQNGLKSINV